MVTSCRLSDEREWGWTYQEFAPFWIFAPFFGFAYNIKKHSITWTSNSITLKHSTNADTVTILIWRKQTLFWFYNLKQKISLPAQDDTTDPQ